VQDINIALGDFVPVNGDMIKSQFSNSTYANGYWRGGVTHFIPGLGYKYYSNRTEVVSFVFGESAPQLTVTTAEPTEITANSAVSGGSITSNDGNYIYVFMKGICWATHSNPMVMNDSFTESGSGAGSFMAEMTDLTPNTVYYVRAYAVTQNGTFYGDELNFITLDDGGSNVPEGAINGLFSINANGDQVYFSQGNLQYIGSASTPYWKFADNQWDYFGNTTGQNSSDQNVDRDLFGWGTSGWNNGNTYYCPWDTQNNGNFNQGYGYGPTDGSNYMYNLTGLYANADWGYNPISNGGNQPNKWRTLTKEEWVYVFNTRSTVSGIRYAKATVNNVNGVILLPDDWDNNTYNLNNTNVSDASFSNNTMTATQWVALEQAGAVFLPAAGGRAGTGLAFLGNNGYYWSASYVNTFGADLICFTDSNLWPEDNNGRSIGYGVRLVCAAE
jgi:hypothetical protein